MRPSQTTASKSLNYVRPVLFSFFMTLTLLLWVTQQAWADENLFEKHYKAQSTYQLHSMQAEPDTKMYVSKDKQLDNISMLENGYDMMGSSGFEYGHIAPNMALAHAKALKADVVLLYTKHAAQRTGDSRMALIKEAAKTGKALTEKDIAEPEEQYKYYASYWAKIPAPLFGVHIIKLKAKNTSEPELNGLKILAVIKDSPAAKAGLQNGDVLLNMASHDLNQPALLSKLVGQYQGQAVDVTYLRNHEQMTTQAVINQR